jgi:hypothetical protein
LDFEMNTRPVTPSCVLASARPFAASALKPRSLRPPMSVTTATFSVAGAAGLAELVAVTASAMSATSASSSVAVDFRCDTYPPLGM